MPHLPAFFHVAAEIASVNGQLFVPLSFLLKLEELLTALPTAGLALAGQVTTLKRQRNISFGSPNYGEILVFF